MGTLLYVLRMSLGEELVRLGVALMPKAHPHRVAWESAIVQANAEIAASP